MSIDKIEFDDKVSTITSPLPEINRITGANVNEIKNVVNNNADELSNLITVPIGTGFDFYGTTAPENYMFADGSAISRTTYAALFAVIGTTYGVGDGTTTFNLPDKRERVSVMYKSDSTMGTTGELFNTLGAKGGEDKHTLAIGEIPTGVVTNVSSGSTKTWDVEKTANSITSVTQTKNTSGGQPHNNLQPYLVCNYIIRVK